MANGKYNATFNGVTVSINMSDTLLFDATSHDGICKAYSIDNFIDIYSCASAGRDGSTAAKAYDYNCGLQPVADKTKNDGYPTHIRYAEANKWLVSNVFCRINNLDNNLGGIGYPVSMLQAYLAKDSNDNISLGFYNFVISGKSGASYHSSGNYIQLRIHRTANYGSPETYAYWNGYSWQQSSFWNYVSLETANTLVSLPAFTVTDVAKYYYEVEAQSKLGNIESAVTIIRFTLENVTGDEYALKILPVDESMPRLYNMYANRYFRLYASTTGAYTTHAALLPLFTKNIL